MADQRERESSPGLRPALIQTIEHLATRWERADPFVLKQIFPLLAEGRPVSIRRVAELADTTTEIVRQAVGTGRVTLDANGDIVEAFGVTLSKTLHHIRFDDASLYSCCALVAHVVPRLVGRVAKVHSEDPVTGAEIQLEIAPNGLRGFRPGSALASMIVTDQRTIHEDAPVYFCQHVHHFGTRETAEEFAAGHTGRYIVTIAELDAAARDVHSTIWS